MAPVRAVLWDADGVLQSTPRGEWDLAVRVVEQFPDALAGQPLDEQRIRGAAERLGLTDRIGEILAVWSTFHLLPASLQVVAETRAAGVACHLATNQDTHRARAMERLPAYADGFDGRWFSCDLGVAKPSPAYFERILADLLVEPSTVLFVDDKPENVEGARSAGLRAEVWTYGDGTDRLRAILVDAGVPLGAGSEGDVQRP